MVCESVKDFINLKNIDHLDTRTIPVSSLQRDSEGYYLTNNVGHVLFVRDPEVMYKINMNGYRTKHFAPFDNSKNTILFAGCSWTFGEGLPNEYIWPELVAKNFENVDHYNIGYMGMSINHIIKNVYSFIRSYGKPKYLFICFPDMQRNIYYSEKKQVYIKAYASTKFIGHKDKDQEKYTLEFIPENNLLLATTQISALEDYCSEAGINLIWTTWVYEDYEIYKDLGFKFLMDPDTSFIQLKALHDKTKTPYYPNIKNLPYWEHARDGGHPGTAWNAHISNKFIEAMGRINEKKD
jgi:hypothetical protein